jgi:crotonobetainyl-CoA:carnitine CoA-transferase CaiB-like acyl-CoA transferase
MKGEAMQPFEGMTVIDMTHVLAGPYATHQLAMLGATVIKIEKPGVGDPIRGLATRPELGGITPAFVALNSGKRSLAVDISTSEGREEVMRLVRDADIFVENFRPGTAARLGFGPDDVCGANSKIVYCSISGWGQIGPWASYGAYDHVVQAATGMMMLQGGEPEAPPVKVGFPVIDMATGMLAAQAISAALLRRARGDEARIVLDVAMSDAAMMLMNGQVAAYRMAGMRQGRVGNRGFVGSPGADTFKTADGYISIAANTLGQFESLCRILGRPDLSGPDWLTERPERPDAFLTDMATPVLRSALGAAFLLKRGVDLEQVLNNSGVPAAIVRTLDEYIEQIYSHNPRIDRRIVGDIDSALNINTILGEGYRSSDETAQPVSPPPILGASGAVR